MTAKPLSAPERAKLSGDDEDLSRSLDGDRAWLKVTCQSCEAAAVVAAPEEGTNVVMEQQTVMAKLPDGTTVPFRTAVAVPSPTLRWECSQCDRVQEVVL